MSFPKFNNINKTLFYRECGLHLPETSSHLYCGEHLIYERDIGRHIVPNLSVQQVNVTSSIFSDFSPSGKLLIAFSSDKKSILSYKYRGISRAQQLSAGTKTECITATETLHDSSTFRQQLLSEILTFKDGIPVIDEENITDILDTSFSLFLNDDRYVLLLSLTESSAPVPTYADYLDYSELWEGTNLSNYTFYLLDLNKKIVTDRLQFENEYIDIAGMKGLAIYNRTLAFLLSYHQSIELVQITCEMKFITSVKISEFGSEIDRDLFFSTYEVSLPSVRRPRPLTHLKQKILSFLYRKTVFVQSELKRKKNTLNYYRNFKDIESMLLHQVRLIDNDHLMITFCAYKELGNNWWYESSTNKSTTFYALYNVRDQQILQFFDEDAMNLHYMLCDFHTSPTGYSCRLTPLLNTSISVEALLDLGKMTLQECAFKKIYSFNKIPATKSCFTTNTYLDYTNFKYIMEQSITPDNPCMYQYSVTCYERTAHSRPHFRIQLTKLSRLHKRKIIFHPYDPFVISIQDIGNKFIHNFHLYNSSTVVKKSTNNLLE